MLKFEPVLSGVIHTEKVDTSFVDEYGSSKYLFEKGYFLRKWLEKILH